MGDIYVLQLVLIVLLVGYTHGGDKCWGLTSNKEIKKCNKAGLISDITFVTAYNNRPIRTYSCETKSHVLNIPASTTFVCCLNKTDATYGWHSDRNVSLVADGTALKCQAKKECPYPPDPGENMEVIEISRYIRRIRYDVEDVEKQKYYEGDTLEYTCQLGFESVGNITDDYDYGQPGVLSSSQITCNSNGLWDNLDITDCQAILCNATYFEDITNGQIWNYTDMYEYGEEMQLTCDEGFETKNHVYNVRCEQSDSFDPYNIPNFKCTAIQCPFPPTIQNGDYYYTDRLVNSNISFSCDTGYTLSGQETWRCKENGEWDGFCARCSSDDTYCPAPCVPEGAILLNPLETYHEGDVINFTCSEDMPYAASVSRECLRNRLWSGESIDCIGGSVDISKMMNKLQNISSEDSGIQGKSINVGQAGGVDVFILVDVSGSINDDEFDSTKTFIKELLIPLNISKTAHGTRLALYMFATYVKPIGFDHDRGENTREDWEAIVNSLERNEVKKTTSQGTVLAEALTEIKDELGTKLKDWKDTSGRKSQQVLLIISDGLNNGPGDIAELASELKGKKYQLEILSVCIQFDEKRKRVGIEMMKEIASDPKGEHFFHISYKKENMDDIIRAMISTKSVCIDCGCTKLQLTQYKNKTKNHYSKARKGAWPWMVQLKKENGDHLCGASIIKPNWLLTAAHCFDAHPLGSIDINRLNLKDDPDVDTIAEFQIILHEKYNPSVKPKYLYDIALIKVKDIEFTSTTHAVCLDESMNEKIFKDDAKQYGVVTGWGKEGANQGNFANHMKQMTMQIQSNKTCIDMVNENNEANQYNSLLMFCAGGTDTDGAVIDTCKGDSGGPFSVEYPDDRPGKENRFVQIGIVSHGIKKCRQKGIYGTYTKITPELHKWIQGKTQE